MLIILSLLFGSIIVGFIARKHKSTKIVSEKISLTILLILFVFGISICSDDSIMSDLGQLGISALFISSACILGSGLCALLIDKLCSTKKGGKK